MLTPYQYASNRPIDGVDLDGLEWKPIHDENGTPIWFSWQPDDAYTENEDGECVLKPGYYKRAFVFQGSTHEKTGGQIVEDGYSFGSGESAAVTVFGADGYHTTFDGITMTSNPEANPIVVEGFYEAQPVQMGKSIFAKTNITWQIFTEDGSDKLPLVGENPNFPLRNPPYADGIFIHRTNNGGYCTPGVSAGCQVVDQRDYENLEFFYLNIDVNKPLPSLKQRINNQKTLGNAGVIIKRDGDYSKVERLKQNNSSNDEDEQNSTNQTDGDVSTSTSSSNDN